MLDEAAPDTAETSKDAPALEIRVQPGDAILLPAPDKRGGAAAIETPSAKPDASTADLELPPQFARDAPGTVATHEALRSSRVIRYGAYTIVVAGLCGLAFAAGAHGLGRLPFAVATAMPAPVVETRTQTDELTSAIRQMADDLRALKTRVDQQEAVPRKVADSGATDASLAQLTTRIDSLESRMTSKLSQLGEQVATLQQPAPASRPAPIARARPAEKHAKHVHDAFDPTLDPYAPGAPRPLGSR